MRGSLAVACLAVAGCGDNTLPVGPQLERAETMFFVAHTDDEMIFAQPELLAELEARRSIATVYMTTGDPERGHEHAIRLLGASRTAYGKIGGVAEWSCGFVPIASMAAYHCRAKARPYSFIMLDLVDGRIPGDRRDSLLHLVDGTIAELPVVSPAGGRLTIDDTVNVITELLATVAPDRIHALDLGATHGRDHSSHVLSAAFLLWAAAEQQYDGDLEWHRGYNVASEPVTLVGADYRDAATMLGYYEACADNCGPCGTSCPTLIAAHDTWLQRQYSTTRSRSTAGKLSRGDACLTRTLALGDCTDAPPITLEPDGRLRVDDASCLASTADGGVVLEPCTAGVPEQYWLVASDGMIWNARRPAAAVDMGYMHVRCLSHEGSVASAPTCGDALQPRWQVE